jgi:hypothetical protein
MRFKKIQIAFMVFLMGFGLCLGCNDNNGNGGFAGGGFNPMPIDPNPGPSPTPIPGTQNPVTVVLGNSTATYKVLNEFANPNSGYRLFTASLGLNNLQVTDDDGNILDKHNLSISPGTTLHISFFMNQGWDIQCVSAMEIEASNLSGLGFSGIGSNSGYDEVAWEAGVDPVGNTTLTFTDSTCTVDDQAAPITATIGSGSVTYKILNQFNQPSSGFRLYTANIGLNNIEVTDDAGILLDKHNLVLIPGTDINFEFFINQGWDIQCVKSFEIAVTHLSGLDFLGIAPDGDNDGVSWGTTVENVGGNILNYANPNCN